MSSEVVIRAEGLSKFYNVYRRPEDRFKQMIWRHRRRFFTPVTALRDVNLEVFRGETFGIVGRNGSGKSTLLQMVCGTLAPSLGWLRVQGRVSALLELGAGFNPEFSGRENVFVSGAVMGLTDAEISDRFDSIAAFADIGDFIDQPVKNYSSGMYARLAFAVAINVDAEILVVDEALSVGDEAFQRKCFARIDDLKAQGCTILFVSHGSGVIMELCDRAMLLDRGECLTFGAPKHVVAMYHRMIYAPPEEQETLRQKILAEDSISLEGEEKAEADDDSSGRSARRIRATAVGKASYDPNLLPRSTVEYVSRGCIISNVQILDHTGKKVNILVPGHQYEYCFDVAFSKTCRKVQFGMLMKLTTGFEIGGMASHPWGQGIPIVEKGTELHARFRFRAALNPGVYFVNAGVVGEIGTEEKYLHRILDVLMFRVQYSDENCVTGIVDLSAEPFVVIEDANSVKPPFSSSASKS